MATAIAYAFEQTVEDLGEQRAVDLARFLYRNLAAMYELAGSSEVVKEASEVRRVRDVCGFRDAGTKVSILRSMTLLNKLVPEANLEIEEISAQEAEEV